MMESRKKELNSRLFLDEENCIPHFQPIISTVTGTILGYEVLGRIFSGDTQSYTSLGAFFHNPESNFSEKVQVDRIIREKAIRYLKNTGANTKLFFNLMPNILSGIHQEESLDPSRFHLIQLIEKYNIERQNIVIEITEEEFSGKVERLVRMIDLYRSYGFKIAIDDVGAGFSNLERIGYIHPDIIKVDIKIMRQSLENNSFRQVLQAISEMALKLGSELLFEGIETEMELTLGFSMGASLLQGFYFSKPQTEFQNKRVFSEELRTSLEKFSGIRFMELLEESQRQQYIIDSLTEALHLIQEDTKITDKNSCVQLINESLEKFPTSIREIIVTDINGYQISPTYLRFDDEQWDILSRDIGNNFAWKPFFIKHKAEGFFFKK
ncbi:MAG: EAL domain-containing protein, partial [Leptospiraceae bacterium]|nr:EAL domain-containing protein [Leptospiraceae bacterium]